MSEVNEIVLPEVKKKRNRSDFSPRAAEMRYASNNKLVIIKIEII